MSISNEEDRTSSNQSREVKKIVNLTIRERDQQLYKFLRDRGMSNGGIFRLGMITAVERIKDLDFDGTYDELWKDIAKITLLK